MLSIINVLGLMTCVFAVTFIAPLVCSVIMQDGLWTHYIAASGANLVVGAALVVLTRTEKRELKSRDGFLLVTLCWLLMSLSASIPFLTIIQGISFTDAYFEALSGLTTTGSTVLTGLDKLPPSINLWRHALHWFGGIGIIVLAVAVLPFLGVGGMSLYKAETPGPIKDEKLTPRITGTARVVWISYLGITAIGILALKIVGMSWFDAVCHAFSAMGLGGFSTRDSSVGYFNSGLIEFVLIVLMVVASLNFAKHFIALRDKTIAPYLKDPEVRAIFLVLTVSILGISILLLANGTYSTFGEALRHSAFSVVSVATTTGFASQNWDLWPVFAPVWMLFLSCILCSTGSTGGGIKMFRTLLLWKQAGREMKKIVHPSAVIPIRVGSQVIAERITASVLAFIFLYFSVVAILTFVLLLSGLDFIVAFSSIVASINNLGPGIGPTGPAGNYQGLTDFQTWVCAVAMLLGRLEILGVLVLFSPTFWRK